MRGSNVGAALRLATIYVVVATLWIVFSDRALVAIAPDAATLSRLQSVKGIAFVVVTGLLLFGLMRIELHLRGESERRLREREDHFRVLFESDLVGMCLWTDDGGFLEANDAFARMVGYTREELLSRRVGWTTLTPPEYAALDRDKVAEVQRAGTCSPYPKEYVRRDGTRVPVLIGLALLPGRRDRGVGFVLDMTSQRRLESQLLHAHKLQAVGVLAGGVAHDFNNLLTAILGYAELSHEQAPPASELQGNLEEIRRAARRASALTQQLLAFGRKSMLRPRIVDLNEVLAGITPMLGRLLGDDIEVVSAPDPGIGPVLADPGQLEQVVVNLAVNARDAMPNGGRLTLETLSLDVTESVAARHPGARVGPHVALVVADTGTGMDPTTLSRAFEPFFTTKEPGKGTGLGLSTVYGLVAQSGGFVDVSSTPGKGTTFTVAFPRARATAAAPEAEPAPGPPPRAARTVLLVEDDIVVRRLAHSALESQGWTVLAAGRGEEALRIAESHRGVIDVLLTDSVMPGLTGRETAEHVRRSRPGIRVLYISGYAPDGTARSADDPRGDPVLGKPFTPSELVRAMQECLEHDD